VVKLIGLYASRPQCGKSTVAQMLQGRGFVVLPFAGPLKRMLRTLLLELGFLGVEMEHALGEGKELRDPRLNGLSPRELLQSLGTDWGREMVDATLWTRCWEQRARHQLRAGIAVVVDDVRFPGEAQLIEDLGGVMVQVQRPGGGSDLFSAHASEGALEDWDFSAALVNDGDLSQLEQRVDLMLNQLYGETDDAKR
jgi:hypothetical protein